MLKGKKRYQNSIRDPHGFIVNRKYVYRTNGITGSKVDQKIKSLPYGVGNEKLTQHDQC